MSDTENSKVAIKDDTFNHELMDSDAEANEALRQQLKVVDEQYGDDLPYDKNRLIDKTRTHFSNSAREMFEAGKCLIQIKENEPRGEFMEALEKIGISYTVANRTIRATIKFNTPKLSKLATSVNLEKSKLFELMTEKDEDLEALVDGGTIADLTLDDIDRMSVRELKTKLREANQKAEEEQEIKEKQLADKDEKINELDAALMGRDRALETWQGEARELLGMIAQESTILKVAINRLVEMQTMIQDLDAGEHRQQADSLLGTMFHTVVTEHTRDAGDLMLTTQHLFGQYADMPIPLIDEILGDA